jgi:hypothetical protein
MATIVSWPLEEMIISFVIHELHQFVNLRMRTLSTRPKPASVAIIDDPP